jgi:hydrogenase/urease accessory protein HupE
MMRFFCYCLSWLILFGATGFAHVVSHFYAEKKMEGIEVLFDVGYAIPGERDDPLRPAIQRDWLVEQEQNSHAKLREETELYLRKCLRFRQGETEVSWELSFIDFTQSGQDFVRLLNDLAYYRVLLLPQGAVGNITLEWQKAGQPDLVLRLAEEQYATVQPGDVIEVASGGGEQSSDAPTVGKSSFLVAFQQGYLHVVPKGLDHILFLAAMFLAIGMGRRLLMQSLCFTAAHTVTLGLCSAGVIVANPLWVEPVIAASIAFLALENVFRKKPADGLRMVMIFVFGLVHGCGFAQVLSLWIKGSGNFALALVSANAGVEVAQVSVLLLLWLVSIACEKLGWFAKIRTVANVGIFIVAAMWTWERVAASLQG